jgi:hypothetical protein
VVTVVTVVTVVVTVAAVRVLVTVAVGWWLARVLLVGRRARLLLVRRARLRLNRLGLAVVMVLVVQVPREMQLDAAESFSLRQQFAELGVQFQQAKLRH